MESYWRTCSDDNPFHASISKGAAIDRVADPGLIECGREIVAELCRLSAINLAGMDVIFAADESAPRPLILEINYFFGRVGLGGSQEYYRILTKEIKRWLRSAT
jgi:ribosomal protein S6--L-glutamate ligase